MKTQLHKRHQQSFFDSAEATEFRRLEHRLYGNAAVKKQKIFMVTSANMGEGKSTISSLLSITHARHRHIATLLIDCDLRRPTIHKLFDVPRENGLTEYFYGNAEPEDLIKQTHLSNLSVITAGRSESSASELLALEPLTHLINSLEPSFDMIILDSPPVIPVSDPLIIADAADGIYWIMKAGYTKKKMIKHAIEMLGEKSEKIVGTVINNSKNVMPYYYDYNYYGGKYKQDRKERKMSLKQKAAI